MRLFGPRPSSRNGTKKPPKDVTARLLVANNGVVLMTAARLDTGTHNGRTEPEYADRELAGELEIHVARGSGKKRVRAIRIRLKQVARLYMGKERGWERDVLFERTIENRGAIVLEEGVQRFKFSIMIPYSLAPFDIHPTGDIRNHLSAEVEGLTGNGVALPTEVSEMPSPKYWPYGARRGSSGCITPHEDEAPQINIKPIMTVTWNDPVTGNDEEIPWMKGTVSVARCVCILYNPDPGNGITTLELRRDGDVPGLGVFDSRLMSDVWTVCALLRTTLSIPAPSPGATIYYIRTLLEQTAAVTSPRDCESTPPIVSMTPFVIWEKGVRPANPRGPGRSAPAIWRGKDAGGPDSEGLYVSGIGRLPNDETGRPSTLPGMLTPIHVSHELFIEVFYSIEGEDLHGRRLPKGAPAPVRLLRIAKPVIIPSCGMIPESIGLPSYEDVGKRSLCEKAVCGTCQLVPNDQVCRACDLTSLLHPRHDLFQFGPNGTCPECDQRFLQSDEKAKWTDCACGLNINDMHARMARVLPPDVELIGDCVTDLSRKASASSGSRTPPSE